MARALFAVSCLASLALTACPAPSDVTPLIHVDPRAAQRLAWLGGVAPPAAPPSQPLARVGRWRAAGSLAGKAVAGREGDWVLENAEVVFVVGAVPKAPVAPVAAGIASEPGDPPGRTGVLLDAADARARDDELVGLTPSLGAPGAPAVVFTAVTGGTEGDGAAWIEATGAATAPATLAVTTRYTLRPPDRALLLETTLENTGEATLELPAAGDAIDWGAAQPVAPGRARGFGGPSVGPYLGAVGSAVSYALAATDGDLEATTDGARTRTALRTKVTLDPHQRTTLARVLLVGARGDTSSLVGELALAAGQPVGEIAVTVHGAAPGTALSLNADGSQEAITLVAPFEAVLPEGRYWIASSAGAAPVGPLDVARDHVATATVGRASPVAAP